MARRPRIEYAGAVYHVLNRGDHGERIYRDRLDYACFLALLGQVCRRYGWRVHAYWLMPKRLVAWLVWERTGASQSWLSARLKMGSASNLGWYVKSIRETKDPAVLRLRGLLASCRT